MLPSCLGAGASLTGAGKDHGTLKMFRRSRVERPVDQGGCGGTDRSSLRLVEGGCHRQLPNRTAEDAGQASVPFCHADLLFCC